MAIILQVLYVDHLIHFPAQKIVRTGELTLSCMADVLDCSVVEYTMNHLSIRIWKGCGN